MRRNPSNISQLKVRSWANFPQMMSETGGCYKKCLTDDYSSKHPVLGETMVKLSFRIHIYVDIFSLMSEHLFFLVFIS